MSPIFSDCDPVLIVSHCEALTGVMRETVWCTKLSAGLLLLLGSYQAAAAAATRVAAKSQQTRFKACLNSERGIVFGMVFCFSNSKSLRRISSKYDAHHSAGHSHYMQHNIQNHTIYCDLVPICCRKAWL